jgi:hypothetical protein
MQDAVDTAHAYAQAHPDELKADSRNAQPIYTMIKDSLDRELGSARNVQAALAAGGSPEELRQKAHYDLEQVSSNFNLVVREYNQQVHLDSLYR